MARRTNLAALSGQITQAKRTEPDRHGVRIARFDELAPRPDNPRDPEDPDDSDDVQLQELVTSFRQVGQLQPAVVVSRRVYLERYPEHAPKLPEAAMWVIVIGNRRYRAAQLAGLPGLEIVVKEHLGDGPLADHHLDEATMIENLHRRALPPLREAEFLQKMVDRYGSQEKVADRIAKTQAYVSQRIGLLRLVPELKTKLAAGELRVKMARELASYPPEDQLRKWEERSTPTPDHNPVIAGGGEGEPGGQRDSTTAGHNRVIDSATPGGGKNQGDRTDSDINLKATRSPSIKLDNPESIAAALRKHLSKTDLKTLVALLAR